MATAIYSSKVSVAGLDGATAASVRDSVGEAAHVAGQMGGDAGSALLHAVSSAYTTAITPAFLAGAVLVVAAGAVVWAWIPRDLKPTENAH
jgi:DHA2 family multidrug resistance protein-like MFS transporter